MPLVISDAAATASVRAQCALVDVDGPGVLQVRTGSAPGAADASPTGTLLASFELSDPAFAASSAGSETMQGLPMTEPASSSGTAGHVRVADGDDTGVFVGNARSQSAPDNGEIAVLNTTALVEDVDVTVLACVINQPSTAS